MANESFGYTLDIARNDLLLVACALVALGAGWLAVTHEGGLIVAGVEIGHLGTTLVYLAVGVLAGAVVWHETRMAWRPETRRREIRLDETAITAPADRSDPRPVRLSYKGISDIHARQRDGDRCLEIRHIDGTLRIPGTALESKDAFEQLWRSLERRVGLHRGYRY